jgi:hypothetical protein
VIRSDAKRLVRAQRQVEKLQLEDTGATPAQIAIWEAQNKVRDVRALQATRSIRSVRRAAWFMDVALAVVAVLTMGFSLGNIHVFALAHHVGDPIAWFLAPAVDLALVAAIVGDAFLSRHRLDAGTWATRLRWYAGVSTLVLNTWSSITSASPAAILVHTIPPVLLIVLAEAAPPYRRKFAETLDLVVRDVAPVADVAPVRDVSPQVEAEPALPETTETAPVEDLPVYLETAPEEVEAPAEAATQEPVEAPAPRRTARPRRATGTVPPAARRPRPKRTFDDLLAEARTLTLDDDVVSAEKIRTSLHVGPPKARELRDRVLAEREQVAEIVAAETAERRHGLRAVPVG